MGEETMIYTPFEEEQILLNSGLLDEITHQALEAVHDNYNEPHRHYHAWHHALSTISWVNYCAGETRLRGYTHLEMALAALYHDAVYDTAGSPSNEERSVQFLRQHNQGYNTAATERLIMLTAKHGKLERLGHHHLGE
jgi:predicted metal-dependent HD superfamily phosphohydrolase